MASGHRTFADSLGHLARARAATALRPASQVALATDLLRAQIAGGVFPPGTPLPEEALASALDVSRNTLREAMVVLIGERLLIREQYRGVLVRVPTADDVHDIYIARRTIEPSVVRSCIEEQAVVDAGDVVRAVEEGRRALAVGDGAAVATANQSFHRAVVGLAGSLRLNDEMARLLAEMRLVFHRAGEARDFHGPYVERNAMIAAAIAAGSYEVAARLLEQYLDASERELLAAFNEAETS